MKRIQAVLLLLAMLLPVVYGCNKKMPPGPPQDTDISTSEELYKSPDTVAPDETTKPYETTKHDETTRPVETTTPKDTTQNQESPAEPSESQKVSLFSHSLRSKLPHAISAEKKRELLSELGDVLAQKDYGSEAELLLRESLSIVIDRYGNFASLFAFLKVPDTETYVRSYFISPLRTMVDTVVVSSKPGGSASDSTKTITLQKTSNAYSDASVVVHELWHMATAEEHWLVDSKLYMHLSEGGAQFIELTVSGPDKYDTLGRVRTGGAGSVDLNNKENAIMLSHFGSLKYSSYFGIWYRLFTLTDFDTMAYFEKPKGDQLIRKELVNKYGADGGAFFDLLVVYVTNTYKTSSFETAIEFESIYLRLLKSRLSEIDSEYEMLTFLQLYRVTRLTFGSEYVHDYVVSTEDRGNVGYTETLIHPDLDYIGSDKAVADAVYEWHILNRSILTDKQEYALAYCLSAYPTNTGTTEYRTTRDNLNREPLLIHLGSYSITVIDSQTVLFRLYYPSNIYNDHHLRYYNATTGTCINFEKK